MRFCAERVQEPGGVCRQRHMIQNRSEAARCAREILDPSLCFGLAGGSTNLAGVAFGGPCHLGARWPAGAWSAAEHLVDLSKSVCLDRKDPTRALVSEHARPTEGVRRAAHAFLA